jgi:hypothetical protein
MKKVTLSLTALAMSVMIAAAQAPAKLNYQGIARNSTGAPVASRTLGLRITVHDGSPTGTIVYQERQNATTNAFGLYNVVIGGGSSLTGTIGGIDWKSGSKFIQVEIDINGGIAYTDLGASELLSVPYALYAENTPAPTLTLSGNVLSAGGNNITLPTPTITAGSGIIVSGGTVSAATTSPFWNAAQLQSRNISTNSPSTGQVLTWSGTDWAPVSPSAYTAGTGITISSSNVISVNNFSGDVNGAPNAVTVKKIQGVDISSTAPSSGQVLKYNGTNWAPDADADAQNLSLSGNSLSISGGNSVTLPNTTAMWNANRLQGNAVNNTAPSNGQALVYNGTDWAPTTLAAGTVYTGGTGISVSSGGVISANSLSGDVVGAPNLNMVGALLNVPLARVTPNSSEVLKFNGTQWAPATDLDAQTLSISGNTVSISAGNSITLPTYTAGTGININSGTISVSNLTGDVSGAPNATVVTKIQGTGISNAVPNSGEALVYNGTDWAPTALSNGVSGTQNYMPKFASSSTLGNSGIYESATGKIGIGNTSPLGQIQVDNTADSIALYINSTYSGNTNYGVLRVENNNTSTSAINTGIIAAAIPSTTTVNGTGIIGFGGNVGVQGQGQCGSTSSSTQVFGTYGTAYNDADAVGAYGVANAYSTAGGGTKYGVYGTAVNGSTNYAGYFSGDVNITGSIAKGAGTFKIDHPLDPENKYLYHSFVESPDMMNIYNGNITTDANGYATVAMPSYFDALNKDFRYQLTVIGTFAQAIIKEELKGNSFVIQTSQPNVKVSWQVTGVRQDAYANAHRVQAEVEKEARNKGKYLHPVELGKPITSEINYELNHPKMFTENKAAQQAMPRQNK